MAHFSRGPHSTYSRCLPVLMQLAAAGAAVISHLSPCDLPLHAASVPVICPHAMLPAMLSRSCRLATATCLPGPNIYSPSSCSRSPAAASRFSRRPTCGLSSGAAARTEKFPPSRQSSIMTGQSEVREWMPLSCLVYTHFPAAAIARLMHA